MLQRIFFLICSLALLFLSACAGAKSQYSCSWNPEVTRPQEAAFCVAYEVTNGKSGSSMPVLEDPDTKKIMQVNGHNLFVDESKASAIRNKAVSPERRRKCKHIWVSAKIEIQPGNGEYWAPQWGSEERMLAKRTFPFYKVLIQELNEAKCIRK